MRIRRVMESVSEMKKYKVVLSSVGEAMFSTPYPHAVMYVETDSIEKLHEFVESQKDKWGSNYKRKGAEVNPDGSQKNYFGYDYMSRQGAASVKEYVEPIPPKFIKL